MVRIRVLEERIADVYPEQQMRCPVHLCIGQEASAAGACAALEADDQVLGAHRSHGHYLAKGGDLNALVAELYGKATGCCAGKGGSMHLVDLDAGFLGATPIVGSTIPIAVGAAFAAQARGERRVVAVFFGEAATEEGVFHESLLFASLRELPVVFVCENNLYSVYSPLSVRQPADRNLVALAEANGVAATLGDGNDVEEVFRLMRRAVDRARAGGGPTLLELGTYRWLEHCGPFYDDDLPYRTREEIEEWRARDPLSTNERRLLADGVADEAWLRQTADAAEAEVAAAIDFARRSPWPSEHELTTHVYAT